jgi:hypothetical protein
LVFSCKFRAFTGSMQISPQCQIRLSDVPSA